MYTVCYSKTGYVLHQIGRIPATKKRSTPGALGRAPLNGRMTGRLLPQHTSAGVLYD
ncbi:hypothetical protein C1A50_3472 [Paenibacillus polymyxa]|nr:hypothetical protein C1A50_3472 [Paenibacillus polymyxa]